MRNDTTPGARWLYSGGGYTIAQRFLDLAEFGSEAEAVANARAEGMRWVDGQVSMARSH